MLKHVEYLRVVNMNKMKRDKTLKLLLFMNNAEMFNIMQLCLYRRI
jgi:hypothetical protein